MKIFNFLKVTYNGNLAMKKQYLYVFSFISDMSAVKFSPKAFIDPIGYLERIEDENDIMRYSQYMKGRTNTNDFFKVF